MNRPFALAVCAALTLSLAALAQEPPPVPAPAADAAEIARLIAMLGDPAFAVREEASTKLAAIGKPAVAALEAAAKTSTDLEVRQRAQRAIDAITKPAPPPPPVERDEPQVLVPGAGGARFQIVQVGAGGKRVSVTKDGGDQTITVNEGAATRTYTKRADGSFTATVDGKSEKYKDEDDFKAKQPKQHAEYAEHKDGAGVALVIEVAGGVRRIPMPAPVPIPVMPPVLGADRKARIEEAIKRLEAIKAGMQEGRFHGLTAAPASEALRAHTGLDGGVLVEAVDGGLAAELGLERLDLVLAVGERRVTSPDELKAALDQVAEGDPATPVVLSTMRKGQALLRTVERKK